MALIRMDLKSLPVIWCHGRNDSVNHWSTWSSLFHWTNQNLVSLIFASGKSSGKACHVKLIHWILINFFPAGIICDCFFRWKCTRVNHIGRSFAKTSLPWDSEQIQSSTAHCHDNSVLFMTIVQDYCDPLLPDSGICHLPQEKDSCKAPGRSIQKG